MKFRPFAEAVAKADRALETAKRIHAMATAELRKAEDQFDEAVQRMQKNDSRHLKGAVKV
jgi:hypothetical protein